MEKPIKKVKKSSWVDANSWDDFKTISKLNNSDASKEIRKFISAYNQNINMKFFKTKISTASIINTEKKVKKGFWVDSNSWEEFKTISKKNDSDSNKEIRKFIDSYNQENKQLRVQIRSSQ